MFRLKMPVFAAAVSAAALVVAGSASASPLTSPSGSPYTGTIKAGSEGSTWLTGPFVGIQCKSTFEGKVEVHTPTTAEGKLSSLAFSECNFPVTVLKPGSIVIHAIGGDKATITSTGAEIKAHTSVGECTLTTSATHIGTLTGSSLTGGNATIDIGASKIPITAGNFFCGSSATFEGSYSVTTPSTLYVDALSPLTSPSGTPYTSTIKAEAENGIKLHMSPFAITISCGKSTLEAKVESHTANSASGSVSSLTFSECNLPVTVEAGGSLKIYTDPAKESTVTSIQAAVLIHTPVGTCRYGTGTGTQLGTLADSAETGGSATLETDGSKLPIHEGAFNCGSTGELTGSYKVTTPSTLYVD